MSSEFLCLNKRKKKICDRIMWRKNLAFFIVVVITTNAYATHGQSYFLTVGQNSHGYFDRELIRDSSGNNSSSSAAANAISNTYAEEDDKNSTIIVIKSTVNSNSSELSQTTMDVITIVWYVATFLALAAFFVLMVCSDRRCGSRRAAATQNSEAPHAPPTPSPSYSEFAPPSYESVVKLHNVPSVYVIPFPIDEHKDDNNIGELDGQTSTSVVTFYTINEMQKSGR